MADVSSQDGHLHLLCWNVNGLPPTLPNFTLRHGSLRGFFDAHHLDVVCFQETKVHADKLSKDLCCVEGYESFWACSSAKRGYSGVATYCSSFWSPLACEIDDLGGIASGGGQAAVHGADLSGEGRLVVTDLGSFVLINVYVPNAGDQAAGRPRLEYKMRFLHALRDRCDALADAGREVLIVGDCNVSYAQNDVHPRIKLDKAYSEAEVRFMLSFTSRYTDVWRSLHPDATDVYTVWDERTSARAFNQGVRIDYVLATPGLLPKITSCEILGADVLPPKWSDHAGILVEMKDLQPPPPHQPCAEWTRLMRRFKDPTQPSISSMFGKKKQKQAAAKSSPPQQQQQQQEGTFLSPTATIAQRQQKGTKRSATQAAAEAEAGPDSKRQHVAAFSEVSGGTSQEGKGGEEQQRQAHPQQRPVASSTKGIAAFFAPKHGGPP